MKLPPELVGTMGQIMMVQTCSYKSGLDRGVTGSPKIIFNSETRTVTFPYGCGVITYGKDAGNAYGALKIAARWPKLGVARAAVAMAWKAYQHPEQYDDSRALVGAGVSALRSHLKMR